ncbi:MAG TPA: carbohydrate ABC transporter permease [Longimicrobiales bacterium]|nr:carbohydrate ABC transporter permease [Longimicrobiales bacterium]
MTGGRARGAAGPGPRARRARAAAAALGALAAALWVLPVAFILVASLKPDDAVLAEAGGWRALWPTDASLDNYADVLERLRFGRILWNSLVINAGIVLGGLVVNSLAGYALARLRFRGRRWALAAVLALLIVPLEAIAVPLFYGITLLGGRDTYWAQILPFVANAFSIYLFHSFFLGLPRELEEAGRVDGAGTMRIFFEIVVPNARPAFVSVAIVTFLLHWGLYLWPLLVTSSVDVRPLPLGMATFRTLPPLQWGDVMAFAVMMVTPAVALFLSLQRWFVAGVATAGLKG